MQHRRVDTQTMDVVERGGFILKHLKEELVLGLLAALEMMDNCTVHYQRRRVEQPLRVGDFSTAWL